MPLWDSVQRGLEKASQEAARIGRAQRLRSGIDGLSRQIYTQNNNILNKTMELFVTGRLTQSELAPLCQEMVNLQQQMSQLQAELRQIQASQAQPSSPQPGTQPGTQPDIPNPYLTTTGTGAPPTYPSTGESPVPNVYAPPPPAYQAYLDSTNEYSVAPPPPGMELTVSSTETIGMNVEAPGSAPRAVPRFCTTCQAEIPPANSFCHNCGAPVQDVSSEHLPTMRAGTLEQFYPGEQATIRGETPVSPANPSSQPSQSPIAGASDEEAKENRGV